MTNRGRMNYGYPAYKQNFSYTYQSNNYDQSKYTNTKHYWSEANELRKATSYQGGAVNPASYGHAYNHTYKQGAQVVKYVKKEKSQGGAGKEAEANIDLKAEVVSSPERAETPPTTCSSSEVRDSGSELISMEELQEDLKGKSDASGTLCCMPNIFPSRMCPAHLIPLPSFVTKS